MPATAPADKCYSCAECGDIGLSANRVMTSARPRLKLAAYFGAPIMSKPWYQRWGREPPHPVVDLEDPVRGALKDAQILIAFAAQSRRNFKKEKIAALTSASQVIAGRREAGERPTAEELASFWSAYDDLSVEAAPASAQSIRASIAFGEMRFPQSLLSPTGINGFIALAAFVLCIALQGFWGAGRELLNDADALETEMLNQRVRIQDNIGARERQKERRDRLHKTLCPAPDQCDSDAYPVDARGKRLARSAGAVIREDDTRLRAEFRAAESDYFDKVATVRELSAQLDRIKEKSERLTVAVGKWHARSIGVCTVLFKLCPIEPGVGPTRLANSGPAGGQPGSRPIRIASLDNQSSIAAISNEASESGGASGGVASASEFQNELQQVRLIIANLGGYWIPMFMGLLGAMTFILRSLTIQLREFAYVPRSMSIGVIRICLGAVAGVFGALLAPTTEGALKGLPPLFIPFVFGYGIEILFSLMDNVVTSFTQGDTAGGRAKIPG